MDGWITLQVATGDTLLASLRREGQALHAPCGGHGSCGKCRVLARGALLPPGARERELLSDVELSRGVRLACLAQGDGAVSVQIETQAAPRVLTDGNAIACTPDPEGTGLGFAADIGTTTVAAWLYNRETGEQLAAASAGNPQAAYGADVISRIERAMAGDGPALAKGVRDCLSTLAWELCAKRGMNPQMITAGAICGNTAMLYLLTGKDPTALAAAPFEADCLFGVEVSAQSLDLPFAAGAGVWLSRCVSAYLGGDLVCAMLAGVPKDTEKTVLLADIGTNGEMALFAKGRLWCCATAAGPAFEGAGISQGMPGAAGAIDHVYLRDGQIHYTTIGGGRARGLCGSGLLDAAAALCEAGLLDETGWITDEREAVALGASGISLMQADVRALQLAKGAICAGVWALLDAAGAPVQAVDETLLAGGFGCWLDAESAGKIGLLPERLCKRARAIGNAAGAGAGMLLLSGAARETAARLANAATVVELASNASFAEKYIESMTLAPSL